MIGLQFMYAAVALYTRVALFKGMSTRVFVFYRQGIATLVFAPMAFASVSQVLFGVERFYLDFTGFSSRIHYAILQALALEDDIPDTVDETLLDEEGLAR
ncbi:putative Auxin-induced protein 5NG4 [Corchorus olitorius]|uniref:Auxin-induced protein 5NG4 n=1 Tax=Corchorus olitorius TaxID=93759 RepID=A0A1R3JTZ2_9ROSI|nr:putative Auxin-induced protein 5NG4 [Corchorus olitorius]